MREPGQFIRMTNAWDEVVWRVVRPVRWRLAGLMDRWSTARANRSRDVVR